MRLKIWFWIHQSVSPKVSWSNWVMSPLLSQPFSSPSIPSSSSSFDLLLPPLLSSVSWPSNGLPPSSSLSSVRSSLPLNFSVLFVSPRILETPCSHLSTQAHPLSLTSFLVDAPAGGWCWISGTYSWPRLYLHYIWVSTLFSFFFWVGTSHLLSWSVSKCLALNPDGFHISLSLSLNLALHRRDRIGSDLRINVCDDSTSDPISSPSTIFISLGHRSIKSWEKLHGKRGSEDAGLSTLLSLPHRSFSDLSNCWYLRSPLATWCSTCLWFDLHPCWVCRLYRLLCGSPLLFFFCFFLLFCSWFVSEKPSSFKKKKKNHLTWKNDPT